jgi:DNA-binding transcriptional LysR family regulator
VTDRGSADAHVAFVRAGFGWSIISEIVAREDAMAGRVDLLGLDPPLSRDLVLVWRADRTSRPIISAALAVFASHAMEPDKAFLAEMDAGSVRGGLVRTSES